MKWLFSWSIRKKLLLMIFVAVLPALVIILFSGIKHRKNEIISIKWNLLNLARSLASQQEQVAAGTRQMLKMLAQLPEVQETDARACKKLFRNIQEQNPIYSIINAVTPDGNMFAASMPFIPGSVNLAGRKHIIDTIRTGDFSAGEYIVGKVVAVPTILYSYPVLDKNKKLIAVVSAGIKLDKYKELVAQVNLPEGSITAIADYKNITLYRLPEREDIPPGTPLPLQTLQKIPVDSKEGFYETIARDNVSRIYAYKRLWLRDNEPPYLTIYVGVDKNLALHTTDVELIYNLVFLGIAFLFAMLLAWIAGNSIIVAPLNKLAIATQRFGKGEIHVRTDLPHREDELGQLAKSFDAMAVMLETKDLEREQVEKALVESEEKFRSISASAKDSIIMMDSDGLITYWNEAAEKIFGYSSGEAIGKDLHTFIAPQRYYRSFIKGLDYFKKTGRGNAVGKTLELSALRKDGSEFPIELSLSSVYLENRWSAIGIMRDITEQKHAEKRLQESEERYRIAIERSNDAVAIAEGDCYIFVNQKFLDIFGYEKPEDVVGKSRFMIVHPDDRQIVMERSLKRQAGEQVPPKYEFKGIAKNGAVLYIEVSTAIVTYSGKTVLLIYLRDTTERRHMEERLQTMSLTDELTGLYNRRGFIALSEQQLKIAERTKKNMLLFFADLDKMKQINDTLGHQEGDKALIEVAATLKQAFRESDIIGRMGGDEFAVLAIDTTDKTGEVLMERLHDCLDDYNRREGRNYQLSLSTGTAHYDPETPSTLDELVIQADALMYEEKRKGKGDRE